MGLATQVGSVYSSIKADEGFKAKILSAINDAKKKRDRSRSKRVTISFIAAIIICFSIILSISAQIREAIVNFFVEIYDTFAVFFIENDEGEENAKVIEIVYEPTYFSENDYEQISSIKNDFKIFTIRKNNSITVDLSQYVIDSNDITSDAEDASYEITYIGELEVYYTIKNDVYFVKWIEHGYSFNLSCDSSVGFEEIEKIISSLQPTNQ